MVNWLHPSLINLIDIISKMNSKFWILSLALTMVQGLLIAQTGDLEGTVISVKDNLPLSGAHVILTSNNKIAITNYNGKYKFSQLPFGTYEISVSYVGYASIKREVVISEVITYQDYKLQEKAYLADEAIVTATGTKIARKDVLPAISVVPRETLEESRESALLPVINEHVPGVFVTERGVTGFGVAGGAAGKISIRGVGGNPNTGVLVLIDGSPQYMGLFGHPLPDSYVSSDAEKVEVIRGPASIMYGSNAMAGVINIISRKLRQDGVGGHARLSYGSYNTRKVMGNAGYKNKGFEVFASVNHDHTDGHRDNSSFDITNGYLKVSGKLGEHFKLSGDGSIAVFQTEDPGPATNPDSSYLLEKHWIDIKRNMFSMSLDNSFSIAEGAFKAFYNSGKHKIYDGFLSTDHNYGFSIYETLIPFSGNSISAGFDYKNYGGKAENTEAMMGQGVMFVDTALFELGGYVMMRQELAGKWILTAGLRLNHQNISGNEWVPQFGINYLVNSNNIIKASVSKGFRYPTIRELFMWQPANPQLHPERMWCYEGSFLSGFPNQNLQFEFTLYYQEGDNLIQSIGQYPNVRYENTGDFTHYGIEVSGTWEPLSFLGIETNYSWLHMDEAITGAPEHQWFTAARFHYKKVVFKLSGMYIHGLYTSTLPESIENYYLLNARLSYQVLKFMNVWLSGDNLLNTQYEINYDYPMPGITVFAGIDLKFQSNK